MPGVPLSRLDAHAVTDTIAPGLIHHALRFAEGPWVVHVLDADLRACWRPVALKAGAGAVGRARTTALLERIVEPDAADATTDDPSIAAGVNADFFRFSPPGVPVAAHVSGGVVIAGPSGRPVLAFDEAGTPSIQVLEDSGVVVIGGDTLPLSAWNRASPDGIALFDEHWGTVVDSASGVVELSIALAPRREATRPNRRERGAQERRMVEGVVLAIDTLPAGVAPRQGQAVLVVGAQAPAAWRQRLRQARPNGDSVRVHTWISRGIPREAVGGFPVLVRRGAVTGGLDSAGGRGFGPVRHPRTAVGLAHRGTRLLLVTVDGRQPGYSVGMTLPELARLMVDLGASAALNLDGGGSTTMALAGSRRETRILNQPSDTAGERPVANALAVVRGCTESSGRGVPGQERTP